MQDPKKSPKIATPHLCRAISSQLRHVSTIGKKLLSSSISSTCPHNMVNFGPLAAEIVSLVWGTPANFNWFRVLAALLQGTLVVGVSQTLRRWTEGATYVRQGDHDVGHWPTFLVCIIFKSSKICPQISQKVDGIHCRYLCPFRSNWGCGIQKWSETGTGSSLPRHFCEKPIFRVF